MLTVARLEVEQFQQQRDGGNLVALAIDGHLAERQPGFTSPGRDQMQGIATGGFVERTAQGLAVDGDVSADFTSDLQEPLLDAVDELDWIEQ
jgi:hypothetical protein